MGFLDNSGDIILDAVLTDTGRMRLARGNGSFKIAKFAFGDDEINYTLYKNSNFTGGAHPSGSAYYDLDIMQSPVLEAFTNNTSLMKSRLLSIARTDLLYLPVVKLNEQSTNEQTARINASTFISAGAGGKKFHVLVDEDSARDFNDATKAGLFQAAKGMMNGSRPTAAGTTIRADQGLDTGDIAPTTRLTPELVETQYLIEVDNRLGRIVAAAGGTPASVSFIDDDNVASYALSLNTDTTFVSNITSTEAVGASSGQTIEGPRGSSLKFKLKSSLELQTSNYLFERMGVINASWTDDTGTTTVHYIDTLVRVSGATTGYRIDIPVRFVKLAAAR